jgi:hypothetical protein
VDTDDLTEETYAIIAEAHSLSELLGAELAVSGKNAKSEPEFLRCMSAFLREASGGAESYWEDYEVFTSASHFRSYCRTLNRRVRVLHDRSSNSYAEPDVDPRRESRKSGSIRRAGPRRLA